MHNQARRCNSRASKCHPPEMESRKHLLIMTFWCYGADPRASHEGFPTVSPNLLRHRLVYHRALSSLSSSPLWSHSSVCLYFCSSSGGICTGGDDTSTWHYKLEVVTRPSPRITSSTSFRRFPIRRPSCNIRGHRALLSLFHLHHREARPGHPNHRRQCQL